MSLARPWSGKDWRKQKRYHNHMLRKLQYGMFVEDCRYHPCVITQQEFYTADPFGCGFHCVSLVNGKPNACSIHHCGPVPLTKEEAYARAAYMKQHGMEAYLRRYCGHDDAAIAHWRKLDAMWQFDDGTNVLDRA